jgi:universal stress protein A
MTRYRRILHATDFSSAGRAAFQRAVSLARQNRAQLLLVHVMVPPSPFVAPGQMPPKTYEELERAARRSARASLKTALAKARRAGAKAVAILTEGVPFEEIVRTARRRRGELIVIGTHGRTGFSRLFLGSVAERVVRSAACPVLTVSSGRAARRAPRGGRRRRSASTRRSSGAPRHPRR